MGTLNSQWTVPSPVQMLPTLHAFGEPTGGVLTYLPNDRLGGNAGLSVTSITSSIPDGLDDNHDGGSGGVDSNSESYCYVSGNVLWFTATGNTSNGDIFILDFGRVADGGIDYMCNVGTFEDYEDSGDDTNRDNYTSISSGVWYSATSASSSRKTAVHSYANRDTGGDSTYAGCRITSEWVVRSNVSGLILASWTSTVDANCDSTS